MLDLCAGLAVTLGVIVLFFHAGSSLANRQLAWDRQIHARAIENGAALYETHCRSCHGVNGEGVGELGPALHDAAFFSDRLQEVGWVGTMKDYLEGTIAMGRVTSTRPLYAGTGTVVMTAWSQAYGGPLRPDEIQELAVFIENWETTANGTITLEPLVVPTLEASSGDPETGRSLFLAAGCADCHTIPDLSTGETGPELSQIAQLAAARKPDLSADAYLRESFLVPNAYVVDGYPSGTGCGGVLTQKQLDDLITFLLTLQ